MRARRVSLLVVACVLLGAAIHARADDACDDMPVAARKLQWIGHDMVINGTPTQAALLTFNLSSDQVADAFTQAWQKEGVATHRMQGKAVLMVSALTAQCSYTLELPTGQSAPVRGLFSAMQLGDAKALPRQLRPANYPLPAGQILLDMTSSDGGKLARTVQMSLPDASLQQATANYAAQLRRDGWHDVAAGPAINGAGSAPYGYALAMQKNAYRLDAAFTQSQSSTSVVINVTYE
jgi:hypothetical protein